MEKYTYTEEVTETGFEYIQRSDGATIPKDPANSDYQDYLNLEAAKEVKANGNKL